jgi:predicted ester cyclase
MANADDNKKVVKKYIDEVWNQHNLRAHDDVVHPNFKIKGTGYKPDKEGEKKFIEDHRKAFPDMKYTITDLIGEGDKVTANIVGKGTHKGAWMGQPPTGNKVTVRGSATFTIKDGKIIESVHNVDLLGIRMDIGAVKKEEVLPAGIKRPM